MLKSKIIIEVSGGLVQKVYSNLPLEYIVVDHDAENGTWVSEPRTPDEIVTDLASLYDGDIRDMLKDF
jgi:hypothetical protein